MKYQEIIPIKQLQPYVQYVWIIEDMSNNIGVHNFKIIPDGVPTLIYQDIPNHLTEQSSTHKSPLYVYGQFTKYTNQVIDGPYRIIGVYLKSTALKALFNIDASEFKNKNIALEDLVSSSVLEQLLNAITVEEKVEILSTFLLSRVTAIKYSNPKAVYASDLLKEGKELKEVQLEMNISERSLERIFKEHIGMSPKFFSRIMRFQSSLNLYRNNAFENLTDLTYQSNYFDQSHLIREFKEFTGVSPKKFLHKVEEQLINYPKIKE
ncbi:DUF6597 domain-containing transcriptional factor [Myroides sp.]|uniref:DUF6597 domain-containing transcriptional factor n=1 Tax=Myroides sp. TaxID=1874736 RepID=UPI003F3111B2